MGDGVAGYRAYFAERFAELDASIFSKDRTLFPEAAFSAAAFAWAAATVRARVHAPLDGADAAIVPGADLAAHARRGGALRLGAAGPLGTGGRVARLEAATDLAPGDPVTLDAGPGRSDSQVLLDYGALDPLSPAPAYSLTLALPPGDRFFDDKVAVAEAAGLGESATFSLAPDAPPPAASLAFLRLMNLGDDDAFLLEPVFAGQVWGFLQDPVSAPNEAAVCAGMADGCAAAAARVAGDAVVDAAALAGGALARRAAMAVRARSGERDALLAAARWFSGRRESLAALEYYQERRLRSLGLLDDDGRPSATYDDFFRDGVA